MLVVMAASQARASKSKKRRLIVIPIGAVLFLLAVGATTAVSKWYNRSPIPETIQNELTFSPFILVDGQDGKMLTTSYKYDKKNELLSFVIHRAPSEQFTLSEQPTPDEFGDIPTFYPKLLDKLNSYSTVQTSNGTLNLTRPSGGAITGILNARGILMFVRSDGATPTDDDWRIVVESLDIYKVQH